MVNRYYRFYWFDSLYAYAKSYLHDKYHTYPEIFPDVPDVEVEIGDCYYYEALANETISQHTFDHSTPIGKLVL